jgi:hypothetical protein
VNRRTAALILSTIVGTAALSSCSPTGTSPTSSSTPSSNPSPSLNTSNSDSTASHSPAPSPPAGSAPAGAEGTSAAASETCPGRPAATRYVALTGHDTAADLVELVVRRGHYVCDNPADPDAAVFVPTGSNQELVIREDAQITATTPVTTGTSGRPISLQALLNWIGAQHDTLAVFTYETDPQDRIVRLTEVYDG